MRTIEDLLTRLRAEFLEMPRMRLKPEQAQRLLGLEQGLCQTVLDSLVDAGFLRVSADGQYARVTDVESRPVQQSQASERTRVLKHRDAALPDSHVS